MNGFVYYSEHYNELMVTYFKHKYALYYRPRRKTPELYYYIGEL